MPNRVTHGEYERPVIVLDIKPVKDADSLVNECEAFILTLRNQNQAVESTRFPTLQHFRYSWITKTNENQNATNYENLRIKIYDAEKVLRGMLLGIIEKKSILKTQARFLITRLNSCLDYQSNLLSDADKPVTELRAIVDNLANESSHVKIMVVFNNEVIRQKNVQTVRQGKTYIPWTKKRNANVVSEEDLSKDDDYPVLHHRLHKLRTVRNRFFPAVILISRTVTTKILSAPNCHLLACFVVSRASCGVLIRTAREERIHISSYRQLFGYPFTTAIFLEKRPIKLESLFQSGRRQRFKIRDDTV